MTGFRIENQIVRCTNRRFVVADSVDFTQAEFAFDEEWAGYTVTATFTNLSTQVSRTVLLDKHNICFIPYEVLADKGELNVYLEGIKGGSVATTAVMKYPLEIKPSGKVDAGEPSEPTPDVYQQIIEQLNKLQDDEALTDRAEQAIKDYLKEHPIVSGIGIQSISINEENHLIVTMTDNTVIDAGVLPKGEKGDTGEDGRDGQNGKPGQDGKDATAPTGTVISYLGTTAPDGYLACNGAIYSITDYPELANHFKTQFGKSSFYGGDGAATFAVPDLRGEFLRGSGTASRNTGTGASVGVHQDGTRFPYLLLNKLTNAILTYINKDETADPSFSIPGPRDTTITAQQSTLGFDIRATSTYIPSHKIVMYTSHPTNTAVLYCIKY